MKTTKIILPPDSNWTVLDENIVRSASGHRLVKCRCVCGTEKLVEISNLQSGASQSCGCVAKALASKRRSASLIGRVFGNLVVKAKSEKKYTNGHTMWICECMCPNHTIVEVDSSRLLSGHTKSCGCLRVENNKKGIKYPGIPEQLVNVYRSLVRRCTNSGHKHYHRYGGRGIMVHDEWLNNPNSFFEWMLKHGWKDGLTIERDNNNLGYNPNNCMLIPQSGQGSNRCTNIHVTVDDYTMCITQWARKIGITQQRLKRILVTKGMQALTEFIKKSVEDNGTTVTDTVIASLRIPGCSDQCEVPDVVIPF